MKKIGILVDSFCGLSEDQVKNEYFEFLPLQFSIDGKNYIDNGKEISKKDLAILIAKSEKAFTSLPSLNTIEETLERMDKKFEKVFVFLTSSALSSTFQTVSVAAKKYKDKFIMIDNHFFANQVIEIGNFLIKKAKQGVGIERLIELAKEINEKSINFLIVKDLTNLIKGGRIKGIKKLVLNTFGLVLILKVTQYGITFSGIKKTIKGSMKKVSEKLIDFIGGIENLKNYEFKFMNAANEEMIVTAKNIVSKFGKDIDEKTQASATVMIHTGVECSSLGIWPKLSELKI
ncbi:DegV family protein [Mesomycoplasma neurolyticum]|nr:DegV family protein [Mesomycoplasma neurolyticum]